MNFREKLAIQPGKKVKLDDYDPGKTHGFKKDQKTKDKQSRVLTRLDELQNLFYADKKLALLVVFQGIDAAGKDGTIRHVMSGMNPQGCRVTSFKAPSAQEANHDFLWRIHLAVPDRGEIGIFNRSHYEDVLVVRVHKLVPPSVWKGRYAQINLFEKLLIENRVILLKFFLHINKEEQKKRFLERIQDPRKSWKLSQSDFEERKFWGDYTKAYEEALTRCNTPDAPWYLIPANKKWFRNLAVSHILLETLEGLHMKFPKASFDVSKINWH